MYDDFIRLIFLHTNLESSVLSNELPEESDQFRFLRVVCFANLKGVVGLITDEIIGYADFNTSGPFISVFHTSTSFHQFTSDHTVFSPFSRTFSSVFSLIDTWSVFI